MSPLDQEVGKVARGVEAITSRWKLWGTALLIIAGLIVVAVVFKRFMWP